MSDVFGRRLSARRGAVSRAREPAPIKNKRTRVFTETFFAEVAAAGGAVTDAAKIAAVEAAYHYSPQATTWPPELAIRKANILLRKPDVLAGVRAIYLGGAGFSLIEATQLHVAHMRGTLTRTKAVTIHDAAGNESVVDVAEKIPPNYPALKDYFAMTTPAPAKRVESKNLNVNVSAPPPREGAPVMSARMVGLPARVRTIDAVDEEAEP